MKLPEGRLRPCGQHRYVSGNGRSQATEHVEKHEGQLAVAHRPCASQRHQDSSTGPGDQKRDREKSCEAAGHGISGIASFTGEYGASLSNGLELTCGAVSMRARFTIDAELLLIENHTTKLPNASTSERVHTAPAG